MRTHAVYIYIYICVCVLTFDPLADKKALSQIITSMDTSQRLAMRDTYRDLFHEVMPLTIQFIFFPIL